MRRGRPTKTFQKWKDTISQYFKQRDYTMIIVLRDRLNSGENLNMKPEERQFLIDTITNLLLQEKHTKDAEGIKTYVTSALNSDPTEELVEKYLLDWVVSNDTGRSSITIFAALVGALPKEKCDGGVFCVPHDNDDFGRCHRLLNGLSKERKKAALESVAKRFPRWRPLVAMWDELEKQYMEEGKDFYGLLDTLNKVGEILEKIYLDE